MIHSEREDLNIYKLKFAIKTDARTLTDVIKDCDVFIGVSGPNLLTKDMLIKMAARPVGSVK